MYLPSPKRVRTSDIVVLIQAVVLGFLFGESYYLARAVAFEINTYVQLFDKQGIALFLCLLSFGICTSYFFIRDGKAEIRRIFRCNWLDLSSISILVGFGLSISIVVGGVGASKYQQYVDKISILQLLIMTALPILIGVMLIIKTRIIPNRKNAAIPFFINDQALSRAEDDLLGLSESAHRFAERVLNGGSSDSLVFGIDAPWGMGKSSFVNFCCEYWQKNQNIIVYRFEPLRYKETTDLVECFVNELVASIQDYAFVPSIQPLFDKYLRLIKGKGGFNFLGINLSPNNSSSIEDTLKTLEARLSEFDRKIIVVVDDLDRLSWTEVKNILFAIKRSFMLPNISYILCYDSQNLAVMNKELIEDADKVREFLEKFVNFKVGLYLDSQMLEAFVSSNISSAINKNLQLDVHLLDQIKQALEALIHIYKSDDYHLYQGMLGDVRKIKQLINTMMFFEIQKTDFENSDFNKHDLIHLMLLYIHYPNIFRMIYNSETGGKSGIFSLKKDYSTTSSSSDFTNPTRYQDYIKGLVEDARFILDKIFDISRLDDHERDELLSEQNSRACFNGSGGTNRNLERYLYLIVKLAKQGKREAYQFYVNRKKELINGKPIDEIFEEEDFSFLKGDFARNEFWNVIANSAYEMEPKTGSIVVTYLLKNLPDYSFLEQEKVAAGSRINLGYSLLKFLDESTWGSGSSNRRNNNAENISEIAEWVFGEGRHRNTGGVLETLSKAERGPLGLFDVLLFRLYCSADRGGSLYNLQKAISLHSNPKAPTSGPTTEIAKEGMREISQRVYKIFVNQYIQPKKNIFDLIDNLSLDELAGKSAEFVRTKIHSGEVSQAEVNELLLRAQSHVKVFVIYQLGNSFISSGVGCGYYDVTGSNDHKGIAARVNKYLFSVCFNPIYSQKNYECFLDYLFLNFAHNFGSSDGVQYIPNVTEFTKVLDIEKLKKYWEKHRGKIKKLKLELKNKKIVTGNYIATYYTDLKAVYRVLDELLDTPK